MKLETSKNDDKLFYEQFLQLACYQQPIGSRYQYKILYSILSLDISTKYLKYIKVFHFIVGTHIETPHCRIRSCILFHLIIIILIYFNTFHFYFLLEAGRYFHCVINIALYVRRIHRCIFLLRRTYDHLFYDFQRLVKKLEACIFNTFYLLVE